MVKFVHLSLPIVKNMKKIFTLLLFSFLYVGLYSQTTLDTAVNFQVKDTHGITHHLFDILDQNKFVLINVHSTSCGPCVTYAPDMQQAYIQYGQNNGDVYFLGIVWGASNAAVMDFDSTYGITYPCASGSQGNGNNVILSFDIQSYPTAFLIAPDRHIVNKYIYPPSIQVLDSNLSAILATTTVFNPLGSKESITIGPVSPNPVKQSIDLSVELSEKEQLDFTVYNILGQKLTQLDQNEYERGRNQIKIDASGLKAGIYFVNVNSGIRFIKTIKFVKK